MNENLETETETLPLYQEIASVGKRSVSKGSVRVRVVTDRLNETIEATLASETVEIKRVPVDRVVDSVPDVRIEGDLTIIPVFKEVLFIEKRLVLTEEIHIRRQRSDTYVNIPVERRQQRALVETLPATAAPLQDAASSPEEGRQFMANLSESLPEARQGDSTKYHHITAFFDREADARRAVDKLLAIGIPESSIHFLHGLGGTLQEAAGSTIEEEKGFWESLKGMFLPEEDRHIYAESLKRGGYLVSVRAESDAAYEQAFDILDSSGTIDLNEQEAQWRAEGWTGYAAAHASMPAKMEEKAEMADAAMKDQPSGAIAAAPAGAAPIAPALGEQEKTSEEMTLLESPEDIRPLTEEENAALLGEENMGETRFAGVGSQAPAFTGREEVIPVAQEIMHLGKREIDNGRVRVHSYTVMRPVSATINLREENITLDRHPVDRSVTAAEDVFAERTIELTQHAEEPVVEKDIHISEEILLSRNVTEHEQTVSDQVRETKVDIDDSRLGQAIDKDRLAASTGLVGSDMASYADKIHDHMNVMASDGQIIGIVDHLEGDRIQLTRADSPDGRDHFIPLDWIKSIGTNDVELNRPASQVRAAW
ncbi:DUF2382 domain-containing protein [Beijerinckia mobilis]|uniref:DUF2382 domain-containing protein n=1 Tax=Beijerinckia mobilis TaxID=231434 RepID=UPI0014705937|nr:DUF2382 domain-containing protein [Beijerinckia mobilis]